MRYTDIVGNESPQELVLKLGILTYQKHEAVDKCNKYKTLRRQSNTKRKTYNYWDNRFRSKHEEVINLYELIKQKNKEKIS
jgi:hypothetical protein